MVIRALFGVAALIVALSLGFAVWQIPAFLQRVDRALDLVEQLNQGITPTLEQLPSTLQSVDTVAQHVPQLVGVLEQTGQQVQTLVQDEVPKVVAIADRAALTADRAVTVADQSVSKVVKTTGQVNDTLRQYHSATLQALKTADALNQTVVNYQPSLDEAVRQIALTREAVPGYLDKTDALIAHAGQLTEDAGSNMFTGLVKGIVKAPVNLLRDSTSSLVGDLTHADKLTEDDLIQITASVGELLADVKGQPRKWSNAASGNQGQVALAGAFTRAGRSCRTIQFQVSYANGGADEGNRNVCQGDDGKWQSVTD